MYVCMYVCMYDYDGKMLNFTFCGGRKQTTVT